MVGSSRWVGAAASGLIAVALGCGDDGAASGQEPPPEVPLCCGCLCVDPTWSCTKETCVDPDGKAAALVPEAGFIELPGADYVSAYHGDRQSPRARVWYSFQPAETEPEKKPILVLFNGVSGPALGLLGFNIGHFTLDPAHTNGAAFAGNAYRWTEFANLLFIDEPGAGFSYFLPRADGSTPPVEYDSYAQGADHLRVVFRFVERHPQLKASPIGVVGESGGGIKGSYMTKLMLDYPTLVAGGPYQDAGFYDEVVRFLGARRSDIAPTDWSPEDIAAVFRWQVFIDPYLTHNQWDHYQELQQMVPAYCLGSDPAVVDFLDCSQTNAEFEVAKAHLLNAATDPSIASQFLRADMTSVEWMYPAARVGAYPREEAHALEVVPVPRLVETFGVLEPQDYYFIFSSHDTRSTWDIGPPNTTEINPDHGRVALRSAYAVDTMVTNGKFDLIFNARFLPESFAAHTDVLASSTFNAVAPAGAPRPGQIDLVYLDGPYGGGSRTILLPEYDGGHTVSHKAPEALMTDVRAFLAAP
jgi:hypothetical protein